MPRTVLSLRLDEATLAKLDVVAKALDRSRSWVIGDAIRLYLETEGKDVEAILEGIAAADAGDLVDHDEVMRDLDELLRRHAAAAE